MLQILFLLIISIFFTPFLTAESSDITSPQSTFVGARTMSLGETNPVLSGDINSIFINPAVLAEVQSMPFTLTDKRTLDEFHTLFFATSLPFDLSVPFTIENEVVQQRLVFGLAYGSVTLDGIPKTTLSNDGKIRPFDSFGAGFRALSGSASTTFFERLGFDAIDVGTSLKMVQQFTGSVSRSGFGIDAGLIGTLFVQHPMVSRVAIGGAVHNVLSTPLTYSETGDTSVLPLELYFGARADLFNDTTSVYINNTLDNLFRFGLEYRIAQQFELRASTDFSLWNFGTGLIFGQISGFGKRTFNLRLDYNYSMNPGPFSSFSTHAISLTILGDSRPYAPQILLPKEDMLVSNPYLDISGVGPKNTTIQSYNNQILSRTTISDHNGLWRVNRLSLKEGLNEIYVQSYSMMDQDSESSNAVKITLDTSPPKIDLAVYPEFATLVIVAITDNDVSEMLSAVNGEVTVMENVSEGLWEARMPLPENLKEGAPVQTEYNYVDVAAVDEAGNESVLEQIPFFSTVTFPTDKHLHLKDRLRIIGKSSPMVKMIRVGKNPVYIDKNQNFSFLQSLEPGKNLIKFNIVTLNDEVVQSTLRVLRLKTFTDLDDSTRGKRSIELMATIGVTPGNEDDTFSPNALVDRRYLAKLLVEASGLEPSNKTSIFFTDLSSEDPDNAYIQAAIENGLMIANPDGTFGSDEAVVLNDVLEGLYSAEAISQDFDNDIGAEAISRADLARYLSFLPEYELQIERLVDWESGY